MSKIYHFSEMEDFYGEDDWRLQIDVTDIWNQFNEKKINEAGFNQLYYKRLTEFKEDINNIGDDVWSNLEPLLTKLNSSQENSTNLYESIYDWADQNDILIKTK